MYTPTWYYIHIDDLISVQMFVIDDNVYGVTAAAMLNYENFP